MKKKGKTDVFNKQKEWQEHQYDPGYYTGGNIHPVFTNPGKPKIFGWFLIIMSVILAIIMMFVFKSIFQIKDILQISILVILFYGLMLLQFIGGLRLIKKSTNADSFARIKKKLLIASCCVVIIIVLLIFLNEFFLKRQSFININDVNNIKLIQENNKNYVMINEGKLMLNCKFSDYHDIWEIKVTDSQASFRIQYEWNLLNPDKGRITKIEVIQSDVEKQAR